MTGRHITHLKDSGAQTNAVIYARVSSKDQEREGFSIDAQLDLLRTHARQRGFVIVHEFVDIESASASGRTQFGKMLEFLEAAGLSLPNCFG